MSISDKLTAIAENQQKVYDAGQSAERERFWDINQDYGNRVNYQNGYGGKGFNFDNFYPKYDVRSIDNSMSQCFATWQGEMCSGSLKQRFEECGVVLDTSKATSVNQMFYGSYRITEIPTIHLPAGVVNKQIFYMCYSLVTIEKVVVYEGTTYTNCFDGCDALENVTFDGVIGQNGLNFSDCPNLSYESIMSVINCLKDYTGTGTTHSVTFGKNNLAKLTDEDKAIATEKGWTLV